MEKGEEGRPARQEEAREGAGRGGGGPGARASGPLGAACALLRAEAPSLPPGRRARAYTSVPGRGRAGGWGRGAGGGERGGDGGRGPGSQSRDPGKGGRRSRSLRTSLRGTCACGAGGFGRACGASPSPARGGGAGGPPSGVGEVLDNPKFGAIVFLLVNFTVHAQ